MTPVKRLVLALTLLSCGVAVGLVLAGRMRSANETFAAPTVLPETAAQRPVTAPAGGMPDFSGVAGAAVQAVTNISSQQVVRAPASPFANDPFFRRFFGDADDMFGYRNRIQSSLGSGVIVSADGYVLTNTHVVQDRNAQITITFLDNREMPAEVVGLDELTDIALLKVNARDLPTLPWGDSSQLRIAEWVLAIGNPYSIGQTVTLGIVSATQRSLSGQITGYEEFIQTDAAINPGNSGGALINARGELVGINTAIFSRTGGYQGIGFAVPSNLARRIMLDLQQHGVVRRGSIGRLDVMALTTRMAQELGAPDTRGALIYQMGRNTAAYQAGLRPGDIVTAFNGQRVEEPSQFIRLLADAEIGSSARVTVLRDGRELDFQVRVAAAEGRR